MRYQWGAQEKEIVENILNIMWKINAKFSFPRKRYALPKRS